MSLVRKSSAVAFIAEVDLFLTKDGGKVVTGENKEAAILLARKGQEIPAKEVARHKLDEAKSAVTSPEEIEARSTRPEKITGRR